MTTTIEDHAVAMAPTSRRQDAALLAATSILIVGLFGDGWAHANLGGKLESFVTPWHTVLFVGFAITAGWLLLLLQRRRVAGSPLRAAIPPGYSLAIAGLGGFFVGFNGDAVWHTVFGVESDIDALLSPTHLLMAMSLLAIVSTPYRTRAAAPTASWALDGVRVVSLLLSTHVVVFFLLYLWIPSLGLGSVGWERFFEEADAPEFVTVLSQMAMLAGSFAVTAVVVVPVLLLARRSRPPLGALLLLVVVPATAIMGIRGFSQGWALLAFLAAGVLAELLGRLPVGRRRLLVLGTAVPVVLWSSYWVLFERVLGTAWEVEIATGQIWSAAMLGTGLAVLVDGRRPQDQATSSARANR